MGTPTDDETHNESKEQTPETKEQTPTMATTTTKKPKPKPPKTAPKTAPKTPTKMPTKRRRDKTDASPRPAKEVVRAFVKVLGSTSSGSAYREVRRCLKRGLAAARVKALKEQLQRAEKDLASLLDTPASKKPKIPSAKSSHKVPDRVVVKPPSVSACLTQTDREMYHELCRQHGLPRGTRIIPEELRKDSRIAALAARVDKIGARYPRCPLSSACSPTTTMHTPTCPGSQTL